MKICIMCKRPDTEHVVGPGFARCPDVATSEFTGHTGEQTLALILQLVARLDHLGLRGEVRLRVLTSGGPIEIIGKSAAFVAAEATRS